MAEKPQFSMLHLAMMRFVSFDPGLPQNVFVFFGPARSVREATKSMKLAFLSVNVNLNNETLVVRPRPGLGLAWPITKRCPLPFLCAPCLPRLAYTPELFLSVLVAFLSFLPFNPPFLLSATRVLSRRPARNKHV